MECPNCDGSLQPDNNQCPHCGATLLPHRVILGKKQKEFVLTSEDESFELGEDDQADVWHLHHDPVIELVDQAEPEAGAQGEQIEWAGFLRRANAFVIDCGVIFCLEVVMFTLAYIGYKVGLAAHGKTVRLNNVISLIGWLVWGGIGLSAAYFVVFHGIDGKTIGKRILGLRVVGSMQGAVTFTQAFVRWLAMASFAPIGLGFLWVLWSREKRAWHDLLARTWVIRAKPTS